MKKVLVVAIIALIVMPTIAYAMMEMRPSPSAPEGFKPMAENILGTIKFAGYGIAFAMLVYVGIKYTTSSAEGKADVKKSAINWLIGALIVFSCTTLFSMIVRYFEKAKDSGTHDDKYYTELFESQRYYL